jgi:hypothetical protein
VYPYNEDVAFERVKDLQREMENSRRVAGGLAEVLGLLGSPIVWLVELFMLGLRPLPKYHAPVAEIDDERLTRPAA